MKWNMHNWVKPVSEPMSLAVTMGQLSKWRKQHPVKGYNDFYQQTWDYSRRFKLYDAVNTQEQLADEPVDYLEFGVASGSSFKWWLQQNSHPSSRFFGFDTFEGLPEEWGPYAKGAMAHSLESINITDSRASFYKGLFQDTLIPFFKPIPKQQPQADPY